MPLEEAELLRRRAHSFLHNAERLLDEGEYDLAVFNLEQYCQLILKYRLLVAKGTYPRTNMLRRLIRELGSVDEGVPALVDDVGKLHYIARLEEAYVASRYLPITYEEAEARDLVRFVKEVFRRVVEGA
ncbi:MAG: DNA-binding protein [Thermofilum sp. NZ13]|nr:MAG: DNA-binding protein [Thermofilum sp. NZ13]